MALISLPKNASPIRLHNRCRITGHYHRYKPPFCERHRWGYETLSLLFAFQFYSPSDKISFIKPTHYRTRGGEWQDCIAATSHKYMSSVIR